MSNYIPTIGLEVHAELKTQSKMFCSCKNDPLEKKPNINICPICMGHPGTLPVPNEKAINQVIKVGLALGSDIAEYSKFDRKNYFYPDLPKGYQISQYDLPFCQGGMLQVFGRDIRVTRIHLEEDTGRSQHPQGTDYSLVDFNRAGVPLMELVTEPDITNGKEASEFGRQLQLILRYVGVSDADMEKGQMRVEVNISLRPEEQKEFGTKVEIKNLNSFRVVEQAIEYEIGRQSEILDKGEKVVQETRGWSENKQETFSQREKESAHDYRYFPEPDIPPFTFSKQDIEKLRQELPELPQLRKQRFQQQYNLDDQQADLLIKDRELGEYFENVTSELGTSLTADMLQKSTRLSVNYITSDLQGLLKGDSVESVDFKITPENFSELMQFIVENRISSSSAKLILKKMFETGADPDHIIQDEGLAQVSDSGEIERIAKEIIAANPKAVEDFGKGKENALQFLVGQMMAKTKGAVDPQTARETLLKFVDL
ncbi:MAG TPA: Asp-tRNA(Asn)/Glu-tRNA(Gln) amidotransferase subunit GatB [Candidatus Paceibacterota bacterium]